MTELKQPKELTIQPYRAILFEATGVVQIWYYQKARGDNGVTNTSTIAYAADNQAMGTVPATVASFLVARVSRHIPGQGYRDALYHLCGYRNHNILGHARQMGETRASYT